MVWPDRERGGSFGKPRTVCHQRRSSLEHSPRGICKSEIVQGQKRAGECPTLRQLPPQSPKASRHSVTAVPHFLSSYQPKLRRSSSCPSAAISGVWSFCQGLLSLPLECLACSSPKQNNRLTSSANYAGGHIGHTSHCPLRKCGCHGTGPASCVRSLMA